MNRFKSFFTNNKNRILLYGVLVLIAMIGTWWTYNYAINFSAIPITIIYLLMYMGFFELFDRYVLKEFDSIKEVKNGNIAVSIFILAIAVVMLGVAMLVG